MPPRKLTNWTDYFLRAEKEEIGIAIEFTEPIENDLLRNHLMASRPLGFEDYSVAVPSIPNTIFIVKPGVTLD